VIGPLANPITSILATSPPIFPNGVSADYSGVWTSTLVVPSTNILMTSLTFNNLQGITGTLSMTGLTALSSLGFPALTTTVGSLSIGSLPALTAMAFPLLTAVGAHFSVANCVAFAAMSFPSLGRVGGNFSIAALAGCTTISVPLLKVVEGDFSMGGLTACTTVNFSGLTEVKGKISVSTGAALTALAFGSLERVGTNLTGGNAITIGPLLAGVTVFTLSNNLKQINGSIYIDCALSVVAVDALLIRLAALNGSGGTTAFSNLSVTLAGVSSPPSAAGLGAKNTLMGRGCAVVHN
jgi:hypothetical protein